jgi:hypothetical protein
MRHLLDAQGREWRVYERATDGHTSVAVGPSLIFDADGIVRRLWRYPSTWAALSDADLLRLMDPVRHAGAPIA